MESVKNQTVKITIEPMNLWIWKSFENLEGIICGACSQYKEPEPQQQQYLQQLTIIYSTLILSTSTLFITTFYTSMKCSLVWNDSSLNAFTLRIIWIWASSSSNVWCHHMKWHKLREIMKDPQFKQQKEKLQQLLKEVSLTIKNKMGNQQQYYQYQQQWNWSDLDEQRATRLAEVLQCNQEQAREYLMIFKDLTLDEIVMMVENEE